MTSSEWKIFLSDHFGISRSEAKKLYHKILDEVTYIYWLRAFKCRMNNKDFDYSFITGKCFDCSLKKYCYSTDNFKN